MDHCSHEIVRSDLIVPAGNVQFNSYLKFKFYKLQSMIYNEIVSYDILCDSFPCSENVVSEINFLTSVEAKRESIEILLSN